MILKKMNQLNDYIETGNGIIQTIQTNYPTTFNWLDSTKADTLDMEYYLNHSGEKYISPITAKLYDNNSETYLSKLASLIVLKFSDKWNKLHKAFFEDEYNPIENYSMVEEENQNINIIDEENVKTDITNETEGNQNIYGFNTTNEDGVPDSKNGATSTTKGEFDDNHRKLTHSGDFDDNHRKLTRSGNIGVTTSQQMLQSEIELRQWDFYNMIMNDIDTIMCLSIRRVI